MSEALLVLETSGRVERVNPAAERLFRSSNLELQGRYLQELFPGLYTEPCAIAPPPPLDGPAVGELDRREGTGQCADGSSFPAEIEVSRGEQGGEPFLVALVRDLTARREEERRAHERRERLASAMLVSTLEEMASLMAHEINQPLAAITNYVEACRRMMLGSASCNEKVLRTLEKIGCQSQRAGEDLRRLRRQLSRGDAGPDPDGAEPFPVNDAVRDAVELAELERGRERPAIELDLADELPPVAGQRLQIQGVVLALLRNALDAMSVRSVVHRPPRVRTRATEEGVEVAVIDFGGGLASEAEGNVFAPFFTTKEQSLGMGLAVSHSVVTAHGGRLWYSRNEDGTSFRFTLPVEPAPAEQISAP